MNCIFTPLTQIAPVVVLGIFSLPGQTLELSPSADAYIRQMPTWSGGALIVVENDLSATPVIHSFDRFGVEMAPIAFTIAGLKSIHVERVVRGVNGEYAVVGRAINEGRVGAGFISWISPDRQTVKTAQLFPYVPHMVTIAPDGTIWTVGAETVNGVENDPAVNRSHGVVRHFDTNGAQIGSFIPRSEVFHGKWLGLPQGEMASNGDRIGWYARIAQQYTEVTFDGKVTAYPGICPPESHWLVTGLALMENGDVIASAALDEPRVHKAALYRLDRTTGTWGSIPTPANASPVVRGSDGRQVMFKGKGQRAYQLVSMDE